MRLQRGTLVCGIDPETARGVARAIGHGQAYAQRVAKRLHVDVDTARAWLVALESGGFVTETPLQAPGDPSFDVVWDLTIEGSALAMASFLKPIPRAKAEKLLADVISRAADYNADPDKPRWVDRIAVFGSYLDPSVDELGDLDLQVDSSWRSDDREERARYSRRSGKRFASYMDELFWPETELKRILRGSSPFISVHSQDVTTFTDRVETVYTR